MKVICISGKAQHGKDTTSAILEAELVSAGYKTVVIHYADLLKFICTTYFNWDGKKDVEGRHLLQHVGTDVVRKQDPSFWADFVTRLIKVFKHEWDFVIIPDCRFPNELSCFAEAGIDSIHVRVVRPTFKSPLTEEQQQHPSETSLDDVIPDVLLLNTSISELQDSIKIFVESL